MIRHNSMFHLTGAILALLISLPSLPVFGADAHDTSSRLQHEDTSRAAGPQCYSPYSGHTLREGETYTMRTSWYGKPQPTASGVPFDPSDPTMTAHKVLPFGTKLLVENPKNGNTQVVSIVDAGPFIDGRNLDVSIAAAKKLGFVNTGVANMQVTIMHIPKDGSCRS